MKYKFSLFTVLVTFFSVLFLSSCGLSTEDRIDSNTATLHQTGDSQSLKIVTTFPPLYAHVSNLVDDNDELVNLVPPGTSIHFRQPTPKDIIAMQKANIIIINGLEIENFLNDYLESLKKNGVIILDTSKGIKTLNMDTDTVENNHKGGKDPHVRLDVKNAIIQTKNIANALATLDPNQSGYYQKQSSSYINKLKALDKEISQKINNATIPPFIVFHDAYNYFLKAYGIEDKRVGTIEDFEGDSPSQKEIAHLIETIKTNNVKKIFTEPQFNSNIVKALKNEVAIQTIEMDPIGSLLSKDGYIINITNGVEAFIQSGSKYE